ncbi:hypothetical protein DM860_004128 [Cuscuta australis]|uniref:Uncharacterized protein n=1 Tax=Cuscuta australis TaxID=267555 RepID=A0A328CW20_9ASTE|nr:hypothetical protein DM860_004128 [Cuscuta australis]
MATPNSCAMSVSTTSPKGVAGGGESDDTAPANSSPKGQCLCSPTTHKGSFRCRIHRSPPNVFKRSNSMAAKTSVSPKSVKSAYES